jgi:hypothetical protein
VINDDLDPRRVYREERCNGRALRIQAGVRTETGMTGGVEYELVMK